MTLPKANGPKWFELDPDEIENIIETKTDFATQLAQMLQHQVIQNAVTDTESVLDLKNFAGQGTGGTNPIGLVLHNYNDGGAVQFDNVGTGRVLTLVNAHNTTNRSDKDANYVGSGDFIDLMTYDVTAGTNLFNFIMDKQCQMIWTGVNNGYQFGTMATDDTKPAFQFKVFNAHTTALNILNGAVNLINIKNDVGFTRAVIESSTDQSNGLYLHATHGPVTIGSDDNYIYIGNLLKALSGNLQLIGATGTSSVEALNPVKLPRVDPANAGLDTIFIDSTNGGKLTHKDLSGFLHALW